MSDDFFTQQRANDAAHAANEAHRLAIEASHRSAMAAIDAQKGRAAMEQAAEEGRAMQARMARENAATNEAVARSALVQEAAAAIPVLRDTLAHGLARRQAIRLLANAWLEGRAGTPQQETLLALVLEGGAPDAATWLAYALGHSRARDAGEAGAAEAWCTAAMRAAPLPASAWVFLDDLRRGVGPDADRFAALADLLRGCRQLNTTLCKIVAQAGEGRLGPACQSTAQALVREWLRQRQQEPKAVLDRMFPQAAKPAKLAALDQMDHHSRQYYHHRVIEAWCGLRGIEAGVDQPANVLAAEDPRAFALSGMAVFAALPDDDELRTVSRLALYQAAIDSRGDHESAHRAERREHQRHAGNWFTLDDVLASLAVYGMRPLLLEGLRPAILARATALAGLAIGPAPPLGYTDKTTSWEDYQLRRLEADRLQDLHASGQFRDLERKAQRAAAIRRGTAMLKAALTWGLPAALLGALVMFNPLNPLSWIRSWLRFDLYDYPLVDDLLFFGGLAAWLAGRKAKRQPLAVLTPLSPTEAQAAEWKQVDAGHAAVLDMQAELPRIQERIRLLLRA